MMEKIKKNFFLSCVVGGVVVANYYANSLLAIAELKLRHPGCEVEAFNIADYGFSFGDAPVIRIEGCKLHAIRCVETGQVWRTAKVCCEDQGFSLKALYQAIRRNSRLYGQHFEYTKDDERV